MKDIRNYLHLYLGCQFVGKYKDWEYENNPMTLGAKDLINEKFEYIKPILRRLSNIKNTEAYEVYKKYFGRETAEDYSGDNGSIYFKPKQVSIKAANAIRIFDGDDYVTGDFMTVCSIVPYLLKQSFDLFNLIDEGLALDASTLQNKNV